MNKLVFITIALLSFPAFALDLHSARAGGQIGEKADGYVAAITASPEVNSLVSEVNGKRRQEYARISGQNGQPVDVVAKLAAQQIIAGLEAGAMYQDTNGNWKKR